MTWEIVVGLITLCGCVISIGTIISNNTKALTEVRCSIDALNETVRTQGKDIHALSVTTANHETRITVLEKKED